ncbi:hypothetical protein ABB25_06985 [Stenotrophomonas koreensis]|uniref:Uncharacterized protein n=1 Tax=Stenotrophomonas koreensis TaxID=266128 RepID=A0A0R0BM88_9GAMM|nr:hypothetical protein ABB25_06985 [Stenotrophomonas koreensis]
MRDDYLLGLARLKKRIFGKGDTFLDTHQDNTMPCLGKPQFFGTKKKVTFFRFKAGMSDHRDNPILRAIRTARLCQVSDDSGEHPFPIYSRRQHALDVLEDENGRLVLRDDVQVVAIQEVTMILGRVVVLDADIA